MTPYILVITLLLIVFYLHGIKLVPVGQVWSIQRLGHPHRQIGTGWHVIIPYVDRVSRDFKNTQS
jgi:regulator of protease activity HflC (stomatin/prohibitin superfamily)